MRHIIKLLLLIQLFFAVPTYGATAALDTVVLQLKWKHQFQFAGFYAAVERGYYREAGLFLKLIEGNTEGNYIDEVISGRAHFAIESSNLLIARNNGTPVVALAAIFQHSPEVIITRKDNDIRYPGDLKDKRITFSGNKLAAPRALLNKFNIPEENISYSSASGHLNDLMEDKTDAFATYITSSPYLLEKAGVEPMIFDPRDYGIDLYGDILFTSQTMVEQHNKVTKKFVDASLKGWIYAMNNKHELIDIILNKYDPSLSRELLVYESKMMEQLVMPRLIEPGHMNTERWHAIARSMMEIGLLKPLYSLDGFLYEDYQLRDAHRTQKTLYILLAIVVASLITIFVFFLFNQRLKKAVMQRTLELSRANDNLKKEIKHRQRTHAHLTLSEERFKLLFEDSPISLWEEDFSVTKQMIDQLQTDGISDVEQYIRTNHDFLRRCAHSVRINNINKATVQYLEAGSKERILEHVDDVLSDEALQNFAEELICFYKGQYLYETESEQYTFKGNKIHVSVTVKIPNGYEKNWDKVIVSLIDVTDLKRTTNDLKFTEILLRQQNEALKGINEELKKAKLKAEESDRLKTAFLSNMSHEIRTPMNGIVGFTDLLKHQPLNAEERKRYLNIIEENSQQLLRIISDIIDISKIEAAQLKIAKSEVNIKHLFESLLDVFQLRIARLSKNSLQCRFHIDERLDIETLTLHTDLTRLRQILTNLLENAVKFTEHGIVEFGLYPTANEPSLTFYVKDTGVGIKEARVEQIFDRFFREEERFGANLGGTGLGLSIAKNLVELLGGKIMVESLPGEGAKFYFTHPHKF
ncbi:MULTISPECIES: ABC transporter substrate-binding protein [unclassified Carboxylicivirga]|uniref:ABC transporter substrate-binding protein n=1 Tax=Carboxylicivirga TaxID=1628153 RepID=UPI003D348D80